MLVMALPLHIGDTDDELFAPSAKNKMNFRWKVCVSVHTHKCPSNLTQAEFYGN